MARLILRRQLGPAPPPKPKALTFKDLKVGEVFRKVVTVGKVAMICTKVSNREATHRLGSATFDGSTRVERCNIPAGSITFQELRIGDLFFFALGPNSGREYMKLGSTEAETSGGDALTVTAPEEPVIFIQHTLD